MAHSICEQLRYQHCSSVGHHNKAEHDVTLKWPCFVKSVNFFSPSNVTHGTIKVRYKTGADTRPTSACDPSEWAQLFGIQHQMEARTEKMDANRYTTCMIQIKSRWNILGIILGIFGTNDKDNWLYELTLKAH